MTETTYSEYVAKIQTTADVKMVKTEAKISKTNLKVKLDKAGAKRYN